MAYFIRDDREAPGYRGIGQPIISKKLSSFQTAEGEHVFIHAAPTVLHDACVHEHVPGVTHDAAIEDPHERLNASFAARDKFAEPFGPGHALCWGPLWTTDVSKAPNCYFCGEPVVGRG